MSESPVRGGPTLLTAANTPQTIVTAGGAATWTLLRDITITNETDSQVSVWLGIGTTNTDAAGKRLMRKVTIQPNGPPYTWGGLIPLIGHATTPDLLYAMCDTANGATVTVGAVTGP